MLCSETLVLGMRHMSELLVVVPELPSCPAVAGCHQARGMNTYERDEYIVFRLPKFDSGYCEMLVFKVCDVRQLERLCVQSLPQL